MEAVAHERADSAMHSRIPDFPLLVESAALNERLRFQLRPHSPKAERPSIRHPMETVVIGWNYIAGRLCSRPLPEDLSVRRCFNSKFFSWTPGFLGRDLYSAHQVEINDERQQQSKSNAKVRRIASRQAMFQEEDQFKQQSYHTQ